MRKPDRLMRFSRNNQFAKFGSINTFKSVNWTRNEAWPIHVTATSPCLSFGKVAGRACPVRRVSSAFQTISRKNVLGLKCLAGVRSLNDRGNGWRWFGGRYGAGVVICFTQANGTRAGGRGKAKRLPRHMFMEEAALGLSPHW